METTNDATYSGIVQGNALPNCVPPHRKRHTGGKSMYVMRGIIRVGEDLLVFKFNFIYFRFLLSPPSFFLLVRLDSFGLLKALFDEDFCKKHLNTFIQADPDTVSKLATYIIIFIILTFFRHLHNFSPFSCGTWRSA